MPVCYGISSPSITLDPDAGTPPNPPLVEFATGAFPQARPSSQGEGGTKGFWGMVANTVTNGWKGDWDAHKPVGQSLGGRQKVGTPPVFQLSAKRCLAYTQISSFAYSYAGSLLLQRPQSHKTSQNYIATPPVTLSYTLTCTPLSTPAITPSNPPPTHCMASRLVCHPMCHLAQSNTFSAGSKQAQTSSWTPIVTPTLLRAARQPQYRLLHQH